MTSPTQAHSSTPTGTGPGPLKYCGGFGIPAFPWYDQSPCPAFTTEVNTHGPLPLPDLTGPIDATKGAASAVTDPITSVFKKLGDPTLWKGMALIIGGVLLLGVGAILFVSRSPGAQTAAKVAASG